MGNNRSVVVGNVIPATLHWKTTWAFSQIIQASCGWWSHCSKRDSNRNTVKKTECGKTNESSGLRRHAHKEWLREKHRRVKWSQQGAIGSSLPNYILMLSAFSVLRAVNGKGTKISNSKMSSHGPNFWLDGHYCPCSMSNRNRGAKIKNQLWMIDDKRRMDDRVGIKSHWVSS